MSNSNCLEGMQCPNPDCQSYEPFRIEVRVTMKIYDAGSDDYEDMTGLEWQDDSYCECGQCDYTGFVADFFIKENTNA